MNKFRKHEQHNAANEIGKLSIMIVNVFSEAIEHIPTNEFADVVSCSINILTQD